MLYDETNAKPDSVADFEKAGLSEKKRDANIMLLLSHDAIV